MAEYIDRANLIARIEYYVTHTPEGKGEHYAYSVMLNEVLNCPAADVVPVVRCKDCKYAQNDYDGFSTTVGCNMLKCATGWHSFCSYGERRDGDTDNGV